MSKTICSYCGEEYEPDLRKCPACGEKNKQYQAAAKAYEEDRDLDLDEEKAVAAMADFKGDGDKKMKKEKSPKSAEQHADQDKVPYWLKVLILIVAGIAVIIGAVFAMLSLDIISFGNGGTTTPAVIDTESPSPSPDVSEEIAVVPSSDIPETSAMPSQIAEPSTEPTVEIKVNSISINRTDITFFSRNEQFSLVATCDPYTADQYVEWSSSDSKVAKVDDKGNVTAVSGGSAYITATVGGEAASCIVRCSFETAETIMSLNTEDVTLISLDETLQLSVTDTLTASEKSELVWASEDPSIATVDQNGLVKAVSGGTVHITATTGDMVGTCIVRVNISSISTDSGEVPITLNHTDVTLFNVGEYVQLKVVTDAEIDTASISWQSQDSSIATIDGTGLVKAVANGTVNITAKVNGVSVSCIVRVNIS